VISKLKNLRLKRISLVDSPANEEAQVVLFKSAEAHVAKSDEDADDMPEATPKKPMAMAKDDDVSLSCKGCKAKMANGSKFCASCGDAMEKREVGMLDKIADPEVRKHFEKVEADLAAALADKAAVTKADDDILKGLAPEVREIVEKSRQEAASANAKATAASEAIEKLNDDAIEKAFVEEARGFGNIAGDPKVLGPVMKRLSQNKSTPEDMDALRVVLKAANAAAKPLLRVVGSNERGGKGSASEEIQAKVSEVIAKGKDVKYADALDVVARENPGLWVQYTREVAQERPAAGEQE